MALFAAVLGVATVGAAPDIPERKPTGRRARSECRAEERKAEAEAKRARKAAKRAAQAQQGEG